MKIHFKNLEPSELAREIVTEQVLKLLQKFQIDENFAALTLSMENSPLQAGPDLFGVKLSIQNTSYFNMIIEKKSTSLYLASSDLTEALLEALNRRTDRARVKARNKLRRVKEMAKYC